MIYDFPYKLEIFTSTTIIFISFYLINLYLGIYVILKGYRYIEPRWFLINVLSTMGTSLTLIACYDWYVNQDFMRLAFFSNILWTSHHITVPIMVFLSHNYFINELKNLKNLKHTLKNKIRPLVRC